jgi:hypothetical protein
MKKQLKEDRRLIREALEARLRVLLPASCDLSNNDEQYEAILATERDANRMFKLYRSFGGKVSYNELLGPICWPQGAPYITDQDSDC